MGPFIIKSTIILLYLFNLSCSILQRSEGSGYAQTFDWDQNDVQKYYQNQKEYEQDQAKKELAIPLSKPLTDSEKYSLHQRIILKRLEDRIRTSEEKRQYYQLKPYFQSDSERITFLKLPNAIAKKRWADARGITTNEAQFSPIISNLIENNDITIGMSKKAVKESWGEPDYVEVAGNEVYGNERWNYVKVSSTAEGYKKENRIIYFESSRVAGWETKIQ